MNEIVIGKANKEIRGTSAVLYANIQYDDKNEEMFFEYEQDLFEQICIDYADPFVLMILEYAMAKGYRVICKQPMTDTLYYNLTKYFIPILSANTKTFSKVEIDSQIAECPVSRGGVGTGLSCGVDSFNVINHYKNYPIEKYRLTHLFFINNGQMGPKEYEKTRETYLVEKEHCKQAANEIGLPLICVNTNMMRFYGEISSHRANNAEGLKMGAVVYGIRGFVSTYHLASSFGLDKFCFSDKDVGFFAPFTASVLSSESCRFYVADVDEPARIDKERFIADDKIVQKYLRVNTIKNNSKSLKAIRTLSGFYTLGKLDKFTDAFDTDYFYRRKYFLFGRNLYDYKENLFGYNQEIISEAKKNHDYKFIIYSNLWRYLFWTPALFMKKRIKNHKKVSYQL